MERNDIYVVFNGEKQIAFIQTLTATRIFVKMLLRDIATKHEKNYTKFTLDKIDYNTVREPSYDNNYNQWKTSYYIYGIPISYMFFRKKQLLGTVSHRKLIIINNENFHDNECPCVYRWMLSVYSDDKEPPCSCKFPSPLNVSGVDGNTNCEDKSVSVEPKS